MNTLSDLELTLIRQDAYKAVFDKTCTISRDSQVFDIKGGSPDNYIDIEDGVPCALINMQPPQQQLLAQQDVGIETKILHTPFGTDIIEDDLITINSIIYLVLAPYGEKTIQVFTSVVVLRKSLPGG